MSYKDSANFTKGYRLILAFGSNSGDRQKHFEAALTQLHVLDNSFTILQQSKFHVTTPFQGKIYNDENHEDYLNFVCEASTSKHPFRFYTDIIVPIEDQIGHSREKKWASRALDIDVLLSALNNQCMFHECSPVVIDNEFFSLPHKEFLKPERKILQNILQNELNLGYENIECHFKHLLCEKN